MNLQIQPNRAACLPTSFAMILGIPVNKIFEKLGHNGTRIVRPGLPEPDNMLGFHIQELVDIAFDLNYAVIPIEGIPMIVNKNNMDNPLTIFNQDASIKRFQKYVENNHGILTGEINNRRHAVAWNGSMIYDPNGLTYDIDKFTVETFWIIKKLI